MSKKIHFIFSSITFLQFYIPLVIKGNENVLSDKYNKENFIFISEKPINFNIYNIEKNFGFLYFFLKEEGIDQLKLNCKNLFR